MAQGVMDFVSDNMSQDIKMTKVRYEDLILAQHEWSDICDLLTIRANAGEGLSAEEVKLLYELKIKPVGDNDDWAGK